MTGDKVKIKKEDLPRARKSWKIRPATRIKESRKAYKRQEKKKETRKVVENAANDKQKKG